MRRYIQNMMSSLFFVPTAWIFGVTCWLVFCCYPAAARTYDGVLQDNLVLGAWLYTGNCLVCHDIYEKERLAKEYEDHDELASAIGSGGCKVIWARSAGGMLGVNELEALATYMLKWEEGQQQPLLPELPPQPIENFPELSSRAATIVPVIIPQAPVIEEHLSPALQKNIKANAVAEGGWIYTRNCHRCHLSYQRARIGKGLDREILLRTISDGKISTQMKGFSRLQGGTLKSSEIRAVVAYITTRERKGEPLAIASELMRPLAVDPAGFMPLRLPRFQAINGDVMAGTALFVRNCITCHGTRAEGYLGPSLLERKKVMRADLYLKSIIKQGIPGSFMQRWESNAGGKLSAKDIDDVVSAILGWSEKRVSTSCAK